MIQFLPLKTRTHEGCYAADTVRAHPEPPTNRDDKALVTETPETRKARILTVDDDRTTLAMLAIAIRKAGYDIVQASCAEEALDRIAENQPDLAVLDISMPGMSGIELARRLRDETAIPFMFLSSHIGSDRVRRFAAQGAVGYLRKPVDFTQVVSMIEAGLARACPETISAKRHPSSRPARIPRAKTGGFDRTIRGAHRA